MINSDTFTPWFGVIEDVNDPNKAGRYRVRIYGYNSANKGVLPTENLKWFPSFVSNSAALNGIGNSPTGLLVGTLVFGFYIDTDKQEGVIVSAVGGASDGSKIASGEGGSYVDALKSGTVSNVPDARGETWSEPQTAYATQYPKNKVFQSESGHVVEYDDTPGAERIVIFHKSGTFEEIHPDGKRVTKNKAESFSINLAGHNIYVNGNLNIVASGDTRISTGGEFYLKASSAVFDVAKVDIYGISNAIDHKSSEVSGAYHVHPGVMSGNAMTATPFGAITSLMPTPANKFFISVEDTGYTPEAIQFAIDNGFMTEQEAEQILTAVPIIDATDQTPVINTKTVITDCGIAIAEDGKVDYNIQLSPNFTLRSVSTGAAVSNYTIINQVGLTKEDIICNLKNVCENVLEKVKAAYPSMIVTSAFRHGTNASQHNRGEAVDIQFTGVTKAFYFEVAQWVKANCPYDQLLLEYQTGGSGMPWIHISLKNGGSQRYQILTLLNHKTVQSGLVKLQ